MQRCSPTRADDAIVRGAVVIDARMDFEFAHGHIPRSLNIPISQLPDRLDEIPADRRVILVCNHGSRSSVATGQLASRGYDAWLLDGGLSAWQQAGKPVERGW